jgi:pyruvate/2-oxoglutarate dehydrogenase complex dihydrolipoamide dehydrogenase (E3) component
MGARVALAERDRIGGECLHTGCIPSKALLAAAERVHAMRTAYRVGIEAHQPVVDFARVLAHVRDAIAVAGAQDTPKHLRSAGVEVVEAEACFLGPGEIAAGGRTLRYRAALIATGSKPAIPAIEGLSDAAPLTNETVFGLDELPRRLAILGGGPSGCELGQAFARLGSEVTLIESEERLLGREEPESSALVAEILREEGVDVRTRARVEQVARNDGAARLHLARGEPIEIDRILVAAGRRVETASPGLERVGVLTSPTGAVEVDRHLRTSGDHVFAAGDVTGTLELTHFAAYQSLVAVANALFGLRRRAETGWIPWATFTDPEIAHVGLTEAECRARLGDGTAIYRHDYARNDRAITAGRARGFAKLVADRRGRLLGATIAGPAAGESIAEAARLIREHKKVSHLSQMVHVYPTFTEGPARAADEIWERRYLTRSTRRLTRPLLGLLRAVDRPRS